MALLLPDASPQPFALQPPKNRDEMPSTDHAAATPCSVEVDRLLTAIVRRGFTMRYCNGPQRPTLIVGTYDWTAFTDLVVLRDIDDVISARIPTAEVTDIFTPEHIVWLYASDARLALQALLDLPPPEHPLAPTTRAAAPLAVHVPAVRQAPVTIRPPAVRWPGTPKPSRSHDSTLAPASTPAQPSPDLELMHRVLERLHHL